MTDPSNEGPDEGRRFDKLVRPPIGSVSPIRDVDDRFVFRFEMGPAILAQLLEKLSGVPLAPLEDCLDAKYPGFYHIHYKGEPRYIGKSSRPIGERLREHLRKLSGRWDAEADAALQLTDVEVRFVYVEDPSLVDLSESALISFFDENGLAPWAGTGYGSKVAGHGRKGQAAAAWEDLFPPDFGVEITAGGRESTLRQLIYEIAPYAPTVLSIPTKHAKDFSSAHSDRRHFAKRTLQLAGWVEVLRNALEPGWTIENTDTGFYIVPQR